METERALRNTGQACSQGESRRFLQMSSCLSAEKQGYRSPEVAIAILQVLLSVPSPFFTLTLGGSIENMEITYKSWHRCGEIGTLMCHRWYSCCTESIIQYAHCRLSTGPVTVSRDMSQPCHRSGVPNSPKPKKQGKCPLMNKTWYEPTIKYSLAFQGKNVLTDTTV